ncbi:MAG: sulfite exporter TauE/SafE family protein [Armatimonadetes bacterium]|nr:sulfite exporter TauE/SafE family protein [Armatimonadota bacterium]
MSIAHGLPSTARAKVKRTLTVAWVISAAVVGAGALSLTLLGDEIGQRLLTHGPWLALALVVPLSFMAEYVDSSLGMGYGTTLTPMLLLLGFPSKVVVPAVLVQELISGSLNAASHHAFGNVDMRLRGRALRLALLLGICGLVGGLATSSLAARLPEKPAKLVTGLIVLSMGPLVWAAARFRQSLSWWRAGVLGLVAAGNKGFMGGGYGPIITAGQVVAGVAPREAVAITSLSEVFTCVGGLVGYFAAGTALNWPFVAGLVAGGSVAAIFGAATVRVLDQNKLRTGMVIGCLYLGLLTILKALR